MVVAGQVFSLILGNPGLGARDRYLRTTIGNVPAAFKTKGSISHGSLLTEGSEMRVTIRN